MDTPRKPTTAWINSRWTAVFVPAAVGFGFAALCVRNFQFYGWSLFLGLPLLVSFLSGFFTSFRRRVLWWPTYGIAVLSLLACGGFMLIFALDGLMCLVMALPLALLLAMAGSAMGMELGCIWQRPVQSALPLLLVFLFPALVAFDRHTAPPDPIRCVTTRVKVHAPIQQVWQTVIAFPNITAPPDGIFLCGIAYPIEARIEGSGVGAVRHCIFSTGPFVEPITHWQEPTLLAFDVAKSPPPMKELSFYEELDAPHLHGHMFSHRGQFRLIDQGDYVEVEGTTWYSHTLSPQWYWGPISDFMIHEIHERVLNHIKKTTEAPPPHP